jgi:hypothetical protein
MTELELPPSNESTTWRKSGEDATEGVHFYAASEEAFCGRDHPEAPRSGVPDYIRSDNGPEFTATRVREWLARVEVKTLFIEPDSPWENGYNESFNLVISWLRQRERQVNATGGSDLQVMLNMLPADAVPETVEFDKEVRRALFQRAAEQVRGVVQPATWEAFWETAVIGSSAADAAKKFGMTIGAIRAAKCRVLFRLRAAALRLWNAPRHNFLQARKKPTYLSSSLARIVAAGAAMNADDLTR